MKLIGPLGWQVPSNDMLGRFAFLNKLPADVIAPFAQLSGAAFTGLVSVPTPAVGDVSTQAVTSAFVDNIKNGVATVPVPAAGGTVVLTAAQYGCGILILTGAPSAAVIISLPAKGATYVIGNQITTTVSVTFMVTGSAGKTASVPVTQAGTIYSDGVNVVVAGAVANNAFNYSSATATANQTNFPLLYTPGNVLVMSGGAILSPQEYNASSGTAIVMTEPQPLGAQLVFFTFTSFTVTNALTLAGGSLSGPLALFGGDTGVTQPYTDTSTKLATMAAVHAVSNTFTVATSLSTSIAFTSAVLGSWEILTPLTTAFASLPVSTTMPAGAAGWFGVTNSSTTAAVTIAPAAGDAMMFGSNVANTVVLNPGESVMFFWTPSVWSVIYGTGLPAGRLLKVQVFTGSGTYTPTPGTKTIYVHASGAGGQGGGLPSSSGYYSAGCPGTPGTYAVAKYSSANQIVSTVITIGTGGNSSSGTTGNSGGTTSFGSLLTAPGGGGGTGGYTNTATGSYFGPIAASAAATGTNILFSTSGIVPGAAYVNNAGAVLGLAALPGLVPAMNYGRGGDGQATGSSAGVTGISGWGGVIIVYEYS